MPRRTSRHLVCTYDLASRYRLDGPGEIGTPVPLEERNLLLQALPARERAGLGPLLNTRVLVSGEVIARSGTTLDEVYFPAGAVIGQHYTVPGASVEVLGVGCEGVFGNGVPFGNGALQRDLTCQIAGSLVAAPARAFAKRRRESPAVDVAVNAYLHWLLAYLSQSVACNALHSIVERCARCLLVTSDRVGANDFAITHEMLSRQIGVRRAGVSIAVKALAAQEIVAYRAGRMRVLDRERLRARSCPCYDLSVRGCS